MDTKPKIDWERIILHAIVGIFALFLSIGATLEIMLLGTLSWGWMGLGACLGIMVALLNYRYREG